MIIALVMVSAKIENIWIRLFGFYIAVWLLVLKLFLMFHFDKDLLKISILTQQESTYIMCGLIVILFVTESKIKLENWICVSAIIQSLITIPQYFGFFPFIELLRFLGRDITNPNPMLAGTLENFNFIAAYLAISLPFFVRRKWCWFIPVIAIHLIFCKSSSAMIAALIGTVIYFNVWWVWILCGIGIVSYGWFDNLFSSGYSTLDERFLFWKQCLNSVKHPVWGHGVGSSWGTRTYLHNEYLQVFWEFGGIALGLVCGYIVTVCRGNRMLFSALCIAIVNCIGNYPMHLPPSGFLIIIIIGLIERERKWKQKNGVNQVV